MRLGTWGSWSMVLGLVFRICDMLHLSGPAGAAGSALIALALGWAAVESFVDDRGPMSPGCTWCGVVLRVAQSNHQVIWV